MIYCPVCVIRLATFKELAEMIVKPRHQYTHMVANYNDAKFLVENL